jgi:hypothetical protein
MKVKLVVGTDTMESECEEIVDVPDENLAGLNQDGREKLFGEYLKAHIGHHVDAWWEVVEEESA